MPPGFAGGIGMIRNWLFTVFYVSSELWGDIVLSLLFWGLANETTTLQEAALLYPLFGVGANIGQVRGRVCRKSEAPFAHEPTSNACATAWDVSDVCPSHIYIIVVSSNRGTNSKPSR